MERQSGNYEPRPAPLGSPSRMTPWNRYLAPLKPGRAVLLWGEPVRLLAAAAAAWGAAKEAEVLVVDAANRFDPYQLVRQARGYGLAPAQALARVQVARAFTSHQLVRLLQEILPAALKPGALVVILGPVSLFYDEQVPLTERRRLFKDLTRLLGSIKSQGALLLLQPRLPKAAANQHFGRLLAPVVDYMVRVREEENLRGGPGDFFVSDPSPSPQTPLPTPYKNNWWHRLPARAWQNAPARTETAVIFAPLEDAMTFLLEISKFLATVALTIITAVILLMAG